MDIGGGPGAVAKAACLESRRSRDRAPLWPSSLKNNRNISSPVTLNDSILWGASVAEKKLACSDSDRQGSNFESCVWRAVLSHSFHHPQELLLVQFSRYVHKGGLNHHSFHFINGWIYKIN